MTKFEVDGGVVAPVLPRDVDAVHVSAARQSIACAWFDVYPIAVQRWVVAIGTIDGGDARASELTGALRAAIRASANLAASGAVLSIAEAVFRRGGSDTAARGTGLIGIVDRVNATFTYVSAGDAAPLLRYADGAVAALPAIGRRIGEFAGDYPSAEVVADIHDVALIALSSRAIAPASIADERIADCAEPAAWLAERLRDDVGDEEFAVVTLRCRVPSAPPRHRTSGGARPRWSASWAFDATGPASTGARHAFTAYLGSKNTGAQAVDIAASELIFGELLGNVVRHAPGLVEITLDWNDEAPVLHVLDNGSGFASRRARERLPDDDWSESGRGLFIVNACAAAFSVQARPGCGTHASATLPVS